MSGAYFMPLGFSSSPSLSQSWHRKHLEQLAAERRSKTRKNSTQGGEDSNVSHLNSPELSSPSLMASSSASQSTIMSLSPPSMERSTKRNPSSAGVSASTSMSSATPIPSGVRPSSPLRIPSKRRPSYNTAGLADILDPFRQALSFENHTHFGTGSSANGSTSASGELSSSLRVKYGLPRQLLGTGTHGKCFKVIRDRDSTCFAVKQFKKKKADESNKDYRKRLNAEFCIATLMQHPNIVKTHDILYEKDCTYEVMEYCAGGDLFHYMRDMVSPMPIEEIDCIFSQMMKGIAYMHSMGVCHRDIKPENIMLHKGRVKIGDFGSADVFKTPFDTHVKLSRGKHGSGPYMAPEVYSGKEYDGRCVDIWAAAILYLAMSFKAFPWKAAHLSDSDYAHFASILKKSHAAVTQNNPDEEKETIVSLVAEQICSDSSLFFHRLPWGPRHLMYSMLLPNPEERIPVTVIMDDPWFLSILVCDSGNVDGEVEDEGLIRHAHGKPRK